MIIFSVIFLLIGVSAIYTSWEIQKLDKQDTIAKNVLRGAYELSYLSNDYLFHLEKRQNIQWNSRFILFNDDIAQLDVDKPEQQVLVNRIITNKERLKEIYTESVAEIETAKNTPGGSVDPEIIQIAWSRFIVQNQAIIFDASQLSQMLNEEQLQIQFANILIIFSLLGVFCVILITNYLFINRRILRSLSNLQEGTEIIGSGNLDFTIEENSKDEIGALSQAFNRMTMNLKATTASKESLENEVAERKIAEERAVHLASFPELTPILILEVDLQGSILYANPAIRKTTETMGESDPRIFIPQDIRDQLNRTVIAKSVHEIREIEIHGRVFRENVYFTPEFLSVRVYAIDITESKRAEEEITHMAQQWQRTFDATNDAIWILDKDQRVLRSNKTAERLCHRPCSELIGKHCWEIVHHTAQPIPECPFERAKNSLHRETMDLRIGESWFEVDVDPIFDEAGEFTGAVHIISDITNRKKMEEALRKERDFAESIVGTAQAIVLILDPEGHIVYINPYMEAISGYILGEVKGKDWFETFLPSYIREITRSLFRKAIGDSQTRGNVDAIITKDGHERLIEWYDKTLKGADGSIEGLLAIGQDVTDKKKAEEALIESEERYRTILHSMQTGIIVIDANSHTIIDINQKALNMIGGTKETVLGTVCHSFICPAELGRCPITDLAQTVDSSERILINAQKEKIPILKSVISATLGGKKVLIESFIDITERKRTEETLKTFVDDLDRQVIERTSDLSDVNLKLVTEIGIRLDAEKQLTKTVGEKEVLIREVHHRVKNNLQIIISLLNLQSRYIEDEKSSQVIKDSQSRIRAMALVHEKLYQSTDISRINLGDYIQFLGNSLFQFYGMQGKGIMFTTDIRDISLDIDTAIPLGLIINELISNSLKYAFPRGRKGEISLAIHRQDQTITILFKDNGVGIPQDFDWRNAKSLGLRLVISLVEQLSGTIELDRTSGTTFNIVVHEKE